MDEDLKHRFEEIDRRYATLEKRFDDVKWYLGGVTSLFAIGFSVLTLILSWNFGAERSALREFQKDIKAELGRLESPPEIELLGLNGAPLSDQELQCEVAADKDGTLLLRATHFVRNKGEVTTGPMWIKLYTNAPLRLDNFSSDEPKYKYETYLPPSRLEPPEVPGRFSGQWYHRFELADKQRPIPGRYPALLKVYYGKGRIAQASITLVLGR